MAEAVWVVLVARVGNGAKSRLAPVLSPAQRGELALAMLGDVLDVCTRSYPTLAVVDTPLARRRAEQAGAVVVDDRGGEMNDAVAGGLRVGERAPRQPSCCGDAAGVRR
jgi:2-phospho-L-lactate guanylyltransferase (CobY/MobA/RfbA family)